MIVFVDDDIERGKLDVQLFLLRQELEKEPKIELHTFHIIDEAWGYSIKHHKKIKLFIVDIIMPPGDLLNGDRETHGFLRTGKVFVPMLQKEYPDIPIIIYTNVDKDTGLKEWADSLSNVTFIYKNKTTPLEFVKIVKQILGRDNRNV